VINKSMMPGRSGAGSWFSQVCLAFPLPCGSPFLPNHHIPFALIAMISQCYSFPLRRTCVAPLTRSRVLCVHAATPRTSAAMTTRRVSTQNAKPWGWAVFSMSLLGMVRLYSLPSEWFCSVLFYWTCWIHAVCWPRLRACPRGDTDVCGRYGTCAATCISLHHLTLTRDFA
jgi:hypothetical protein